MTNNIFKKGIDYRPSRRKAITRDEVLYEYLNTHHNITRDDFNNIGINSTDCKVNQINRGGVFILTPYQKNRNGWYVKKG